ncbi:IS3 family transposase [Lysinibacillus sphaericus]
MHFEKELDAYIHYYNHKRMKTKSSRRE